MDLRQNHENSPDIQHSNAKDCKYFSESRRNYNIVIIIMIMIIIIIIELL